jgi:TatD DNase family protein
MVETDAPFLAPEPHRGKRCEPAFVMETAKRIAAEKDISIDELARITTENALKLFPSIRNSK